MKKTNKSETQTQPGNMYGIGFDSRNINTQESNISFLTTQRPSTKQNANQIPLKIIESMDIENYTPLITKNEGDGKVHYPGQSSVSDSKSMSLSIGLIQPGSDPGSSVPSKSRIDKIEFFDEPPKSAWPIEANLPSVIGGCNGGVFLKNEMLNDKIMLKIEPPSEPKRLSYVPIPSDLIRPPPLDPGYKDRALGKTYQSFLPTMPPKANLPHSNTLPPDLVAHSINQNSLDIPLIYPTDVKRNSHQFQYCFDPQLSRDIPLTTNSSPITSNIPDVPLPNHNQPEKSIELNIGRYSAISINMVNNQLLQEVNKNFNYSGFNNNRSSS